jgi:FtsP/CotA-like multicopper oxidase with cupredoxin domain
MLARLLACVWLALLPRPSLAQTPSTAAPPCSEETTARSASADLYCIELLPAAAGEGASGTARLLPASSPFGVPVTSEGFHRYNLSFDLSGLPDPASLGPYATYVAWVATPQLAVVSRLGEVANGVVVRGPVALDRFLVLISAEARADAPERSGPLVLRGASAGLRLQPHDAALMLSAMLDRPDAPAGHADHAVAEPGSWTPPPMHEAVAMPPQLMTLRPRVSPWRPEPPGDVPIARSPELVRLSDGDTLELTAAPVRRQLLNRSVVLLGFNGQLPGPLLAVEQAATVHVRFVNRTDLPTAVHWHGVRLDNRFDGVPHVTQEPVAPGASFDYSVRFPDPGIYWYHPHHREDVLQDLGLYGNLWVEPSDPNYFGPAHRDEFLILDDLLIGESGPVQHGTEAPTHALMGRFGNLLLVNGEPRWDDEARVGEVVRLYLTNVASTRVFNLSFGPGVRMKVVASDLGRFQREQWVESVVIAPAERYVVDVRFEAAGEVALVNRVRPIDPLGASFFDETDTVGVVRVAPEAARPDHGPSFERLRASADAAALGALQRAHLDRTPDHELVIGVRASDSLPFPILPLLRLESVYRHPVEWTGVMPEMDWVATGRDVRWALRETATGRENMDIAWRFRVGDLVKIRLVNDRNSLHAMQHPIHIHGQRFLVLSVNDVPEDNLVWKDTVLVPTGFVTDILLEVTNPGRWMIHCHVAEHIETGMQMVFDAS